MLCWKKLKCLRHLLYGLLFLPAYAAAWEEQAVLEFVMASNPMLHAYQVVTREYAPLTWAERLLEQTFLFARASTNGNSLQATNNFFTTGTTAGVQLHIPLTSRKESREHALRVLEETRAMEQVRSEALQTIAQLRQHEADFAAAKTRLKLYKDKSGWTQQRVKTGYDEVGDLWALAQNLNEEQAAVEKLSLLIASQRYKVASYAGGQWPVLLTYLKGEGELSGYEADYQADGAGRAHQPTRQGTAQRQTRAPNWTSGNRQVSCIECSDSAAHRTEEFLPAGETNFP